MPAYYDKEKRTWYAKFRYKDWTGKSSSTTKRGFKTKKDALKYERDYKDARKATPDMTVAHLVSIFLESMKTRLSPSSYLQKESILRRYVVPKLGDIPLSKLTRPVIVRWQDWLMKQLSLRGGKPLSENRLRNINCQLIILLNYAVKLDYLPKSPMTGLKPIGKVNKRLEFWEKDDYDRFIAAGKGDKNYELFKLCFDVLFYSGLRIAEFCGLGKDSFDFDRDIIIVNQAANDNGEAIPLKTKSSYREITMPHSIMQRIKEFAKKWNTVPKTGFFAVSRVRLRASMRRWSEKAGLKYILVHGLRHSHVSYLIKLGVPITAISHRLGHKNSQITLSTYSHMYHEDDPGIARLLESKM